MSVTSVMRRLLRSPLTLVPILLIFVAGTLTAQTSQLPAFTELTAPLEIVEGNYEVSGMVSLTDMSPVPRAMRISGGADANLFRLGTALAPGTGGHLPRARRLIFNQRPDFEIPRDQPSSAPPNKANNNLYIVEITADFDGLDSVIQIVTVQVTDADEPPVFTSLTQVEVIEFNTVVTDLIVVSVKGVPLAPETEVQFSVEPEDGNANTIFDADNSLFQISANNLLTFISPPNAGRPRSAVPTATNRNLYRVRVSAIQVGTTAAFSINSDIEIRVLDTDNPPRLDTSISPISTFENETTIAILSASDPDGDAVTFALLPSRHSHLFRLNSLNGVLSWVTPPDFERPPPDRLQLNTGTNPQYLARVAALSGQPPQQHTADLLVMITDVAEAPASQALLVNRYLPSGMQQVVATASLAAISGVDARSAPGEAAYTFRLDGGADQPAFTLQGGYLMLISPLPLPNAPNDANTDGRYEVDVRISGTSGSGVAEETLVSVHLYLSPSVSENTDLVMIVPPATQITGGADEALFRIRDDVLRFLMPPDYEAPSDQAGTAPDGADQDAAGNNRYLVEITTGSGVRSLLVFVTDNQLEVEAGAAQTALPGEIVTLTASAQITQPTYRWRFVSSSARMREQMPLLNADQAAMQFIVPADAANETLTFEVDTGGGTEQSRDRVTVSVQSVLSLQDESLNMPEDRAVGTPIGTPLAISDKPDFGVPLWTIEAGNPQSLFEIDETTGQVSLVEPLNSDQFALPPVYVLQLQFEFRVSTANDIVTLAADGVLTITVTGINEAPSANAGGDQRVTSGSIVQLIGIGSDMETQNAQLIYSWGLSDPNISITGGNTARPIFAAPSTGTEDVIIIATLTVTDNDPRSPLSAVDSSTVIVSSSTEPSLMSAMVTLPEDTAAGALVSDALDGSNFPSGDSVWSFESGNLDNVFAIHPSSGAVTLLNELDFEGPRQSYDLVVQRTVGAASAGAALTISVTDADDAPVARVFGPAVRVVTSGAQVSLRAEFTEQDPEMIGDDPEMMMPNPNAMEITHLWTLSDGSITIADADQLEVSFTAPNSPTTLSANFALSQGGNEVIQLTQMITVVVGDQGPQITSTDFTVMEGALRVGQMVPATDADGDPVIFMLASGDDAALFGLTSGGLLSFLTEPDFETPASNDSPPTNSYVVNIQAISERDGENPLTMTQSINVVVEDNIDEAPQFSGDATQIFSVAEGVVAVATLPALEPESQDLTYSLGGPDRAVFRVESGGQVMFRQPPDYENPLDVESDSPENLAGNNEYVVTIIATSIADPVSPMPLNDVVTLVITVTNVEDETLPPPEYPGDGDAYSVSSSLDNYVVAGLAIGPALMPPDSFSSREIVWTVEYIGMYDVNDLNDPTRLIDRTNEDLFTFSTPSSQLATGAGLSSDAERFQVRLRARNFYGDEITQQFEVLINPDTTPGSVALSESAFIIGTKVSAVLTDEGFTTNEAANAAAAWQWQYLDEGSLRWLNITGATDVSFTPGTFFRLRRLRVQANYIEDGIRRQVATAEQTFQPLAERNETIARLLGVLAREITADAVSVISSRFITRGREYALFGDIGGSGQGDVWGLAAAQVLRDVGEQQINSDWFWQNLRGSRFAMQINRANGGNYEDAASSPITIWGEGGYQLYKSDPTADVPRLSGNLTTAYFGVDWQFSFSGMVGLAYSHSRGRNDFTSTADGSGSFNTRLNIVYPYVHYLLDDTVLLWGALGYGEGRGDYQLPARSESERASLTYLMVAGGFRQSVAPGSNFGLAWKGDFSSARLTGEGNTGIFPKTDGTSKRARLAVEASWNAYLSDATIFSSSVDFGARYDSGVAETGFGIDLYFDATLRNTNNGFTITARGNTLLDHEAGGMKSYGGAIGISFEPTNYQVPEGGWAPFIEVAMADQSAGAAVTAGIRLTKRADWSVQLLATRGARQGTSSAGGSSIARMPMLPADSRHTQVVPQSNAYDAFPNTTLFMLQLALRL